MRTIDGLRRSGVGIAPDRTVTHAAKIMEVAAVGALAVVDGEDLVGIVTDRDLVRRAMAARLSPDARVDSVMSSPVVTIDAEADLHGAFTLFRTHAVRRVAVVARRPVRRDDLHRRPARRPRRRPRRPGPAGDRRNPLRSPRRPGARRPLTALHERDGSMRPKRLVFALAAVGALLAAACSSDRGVDESGGLGPGGESAATVEARGGGGAGDFGDLAEVCGPNEDGGTVPDAGPEEVQGITEDTITLGTVADPGFEGRPGLNQEIFDAAEAFVEWCNAAGGINGKQLELNLHDAAVTEYQPVMAEACRQDFAIVGSRRGPGQLLDLHRRGV